MNIHHATQYPAATMTTIRTVRRPPPFRTTGDNPEPGEEKRI